MQIISIKKGDSIYIGNNIYLSIQRIRSKKGIEIAIKAPSNVQIHREEFWKVLLALQKKLGINIHHSKI